MCIRDSIKAFSVTVTGIVFGISIKVVTPPLAHALLPLVKSSLDVYKRQIFNIILFNSSNSFSKVFDSVHTTANPKNSAKTNADVYKRQVAFFGVIYKVIPHKIVVQILVRNTVKSTHKHLY